MKKWLSLVAVLLIATSSALAGEGMWLLNKLKQVNEAEMRAMGFKLTAEDIYDINKSCMKDAVARLGGGFCSGEMISAEGLLLTNHHCGFDAIQSFSTVEHDYLTDGFWAMTRDQELNVPGLYVSYLQRIDDVSDKVLAELTAGMSEEERNAKIQEVAAKLEQEAVGEQQFISADFKAMYEGNEFYLFIYKDYPDVRLVGAPPSAIGKFGGDTDNWMWPRHTGDFSMFRVYTGPDGEPAEFAAGNVAFKPKWHFPVSLNGVKKGDFAMIMGFPGSTDRFLSSQGVKLALDIEQPSRVKIRGERLDIMKRHMDADPAIRIKYASKHAQISNYWKYFIGQQRGLKRLHVYDKKVKQEQDLMAWVNADPARKEKYGAILSSLDAGYNARGQYEKAFTYMQEAAFGSEAITFSFRLRALKEQMEKDPKNNEAISSQVAQIQAGLEEFWKDYDPATDQEVTAAMYKMIHDDVDPSQWPDVINMVEKKYKGDFNAWAKALFATSLSTDRKRMETFLSKPSLKVLQKDMALQAALGVRTLYRGQLMAGIQGAQNDLDKGYRLMVAAMREKDPIRMWYPNANSTLRLTYGKVNDYKPGDAMHYELETTADGILEKEDNTNEEFVVPKRQHELFEKRDYGRYADANGELVTCFISENDITGGNSGSPVINGNGELIGIAFDGNWEAMSGDIAYEPELQRTISVDIRYVLWIIDKYAGATNLVNEMTLVQGPAIDSQEKVQLEMMPAQPVRATTTN